MHTNNLLSNNQAFNGIYRGRLLQKSEDDIRVFVPGIYNSQIKESNLEDMIDCFPKIQWCAYNLESIDINNQDNSGKGPAMIMFENGDLQRPVVLSYVVIGGGDQSGYYDENGNYVSVYSDGSNITSGYIPDVINESLQLSDISNLSKKEYLELVCPIYKEYCKSYGLKYPGVLALQPFYEVNANFPRVLSNVARSDNNLGGLKYSSSVPGATRGSSVPSNETGGNYCRFSSISEYYRAHAWQIGTSSYYSAARNNQSNVTSFTRTLLNTWVKGNINQVPSGPISYSESIISDYNAYGLSQYEN